MQGQQSPATITKAAVILASAWLERASVQQATTGQKRIDEIDRNLVSLLAKRGRLVTQAAAFKKNTDDVRAPARIEQVIRKVREMAAETGASAEVVQQVYRAMI
ncbi:chorismate mutase [Pseudomonas plecoglossicida]|nr:chorismate mutase [Pseudomonas plecoglossicida]MBA1196922.1 chorismate mutase [Pseudomonas plecoglossicida]